MKHRASCFSFARRPDASGPGDRRLEIGDYTRFRSNRQAISCCGLCADEKSSADKVMRMPLSKQRNKHIQRVLVEAAKLAPRESPERTMVRARELERGNPSRAKSAP